MAHIILIEPDKVLAKTYKQALELADHTVSPCASAQAAIFACDERGPDIIVLELQLIEHSGIEFLYELRSYPEWQQIPVVINSSVPAGEFSLNTRMLREQLGVSQYLYKPHTSLKSFCAVIEEFAKVTK